MNASSLPMNSRPSTASRSTCVRKRLVVNVVVHGYEDHSPHQIAVDTAYDATFVTIAVLDDGIPTASRRQRNRRPRRSGVAAYPCWQAAARFVNGIDLSLKRFNLESDLILTSAR